MITERQRLAAELACQLGTTTAAARVLGVRRQCAHQLATLGGWRPTKKVHPACAACGKNIDHDNISGLCRRCRHEARTMLLSCACGCGRIFRRKNSAVLRVGARHVFANRQCKVRFEQPWETTRKHDPAIVMAIFIATGEGPRRLSHRLGIPSSAVDRILRANVGPSPCLVWQLGLGEDMKYARALPTA